MNDADLSRAVVEAIGDTAAPHVDKAKLLEIYGPEAGEAIAEEVTALVREAIATPIEWGNMTLLEGTNDIMGRFRKVHPGLTLEALQEIARCVGWSWR